MPPKVNGDSSLDFKFMWSCLMNAETKPKINWAGVAKEMELKNAACASARFGQILRKHNFPNKWSSNPNAAPDTPAATPVKRKRAESGKSTSKRAKKSAAPADEDGDDEEPLVQTPTKTADDDADTDAMFLAKLGTYPDSVQVKEECDGNELAVVKDTIEELLENHDKIHPKILMQMEMQAEDEKAQAGNYRLLDVSSFPKL